MFIKTSLGCSLYELYFGNLGGLNDGIGRKGVSHILEHLKAAEMRKYKDYEMQILRNGVKATAITNPEYVKFAYKGMNLSHNYLREVSDIIVDALLNSSPLSEDEFKGELATVQNEYLRHMHSASNIVHYYKNKHIFGDFGSVIGEGEDIINYAYSEYLKDREIFKIPTQILLIDTEDWNELNYDLSLTDNKRLNYTIHKNEISEKSKNVFFIAKPASDDKAASLLELGKSCLAHDLRCPLQKILRIQYNLIYCVEEEVTELKDLFSFFRIFTTDPKSAIEIAYEVLSNPYKYISKDHFELYKRITMIQNEARQFYKEMASKHFIRDEAGFTVTQYDMMKNATYEECMETIKEYFVTEGQCYQYQ